jgi:hypothetical protein
MESEQITLLGAHEAVAAWDLDCVSSEDSASGSVSALAEPTNPAPSAAMPPKTTRLPLEKVPDPSLEASGCNSLLRSLTVASESALSLSHIRRYKILGNSSSVGAVVDFAAHNLNRRYGRTNAFIVPQRFPTDRPEGEIEYWPTDAGIINVSA